MWFGGPDHVGQEVVVPSGALGFAAHGVPSGFDAGDVQGRVRSRRRFPFTVTSDTRCNGFPIAQRPHTACRNRCGGSSALMMRRRVPVVVPAPIPRTATTFPTGAGPGRQCRPWSRSMPWATPALRVPMRPRLPSRSRWHGRFPSRAGASGYGFTSSYGAPRLPFGAGTGSPSAAVTAGAVCASRPPSQSAPLSRLFRLKLVAPRWRCT